MGADRVLFVERDVAHYVALENTVVLGKAKPERVRGRIVNVHSIEDLELGSKGVFRINAERNAVIAGARSVETHARKAPRIVCLRQGELI